MGGKNSEAKMFFGGKFLGWDFLDFLGRFLENARSLHGTFAPFNVLSNLDCGIMTRILTTGVGKKLHASILDVKDESWTFGRRRCSQGLCGVSGCGSKRYQRR